MVKRHFPSSSFTGGEISRCACASGTGREKKGKKKEEEEERFLIP